MLSDILFSVRFGLRWQDRNPFISGCSAKRWSRTSWAHRSLAHRLLNDARCSSNNISSIISFTFYMLKFNRHHIHDWDLHKSKAWNTPVDTEPDLCHVTSQKLKVTRSERNLRIVGLDPRKPRDNWTQTKVRVKTEIEREHPLCQKCCTPPNNEQLWSKWLSIHILSFHALSKKCFVLILRSHHSTKPYLTEIPY